MRLEYAMFPPFSFGLEVLFSRLHEVCLTWTDRGGDQKLSVKAAKAHKINSAFIFSVVLQLISRTTFANAIQFLVVNVAGLWR